MERAYQIDGQKGIDRFRSYLNTNPGNIQFVLVLADLAQRVLAFMPGSGRKNCGP